ncbi:isochorismatase family protein [Microbulbifer hydrolyticus]|uniref:Isochorismatase family protein n=1 Tax=Microbulbifer hydrolyticus TaxID=48074 RepID=A0A6P1T950_9GAMM|nr:isochorismatase family protein [Microbulbifer hydrolyticus]MBB5210151.1 nicotinamidase-related amidase [Microbulbifer hydrolyticus]QHQ39334.1 isochorismatase family protein [Microbulbifer hydrolyticus]
MDLVRKSLGLGKKPALLLVDMIVGFTSSRCPLGTDCPEVVAANRRLLDRFRRLGLPVVYTTVVYHHDGEARVFRDRIQHLNVLTPDSEWVQVDPRLAPRDDEPVFSKQWASSFHRTGLDGWLREQGVDSLVVTGLTTSGCVRATVVDGLQYDYPVVVPREAVGDRNPDAHRANLFDMHAKYADVLSLSQVLALLPETHKELS